MKETRMDRVGRGPVQMPCNGGKASSGRKLFVLSGVSNVGKTTTLNLLAAKLYNATARFKMIDGPRPPETGHSDARYVFEDVQTGLLVGISTAGDDADAINKGFAYFDISTRWCDTCFIASKTSGKSIVAIEKNCASRQLIPQYRFLIKAASRYRSTAKVRTDVVNQLYSGI